MPWWMARWQALRPGVIHLGRDVRAGVLEHLRDHPPGAVALPLQHAQREVVVVETASVGALISDDHMRRDHDDLRRDDPDRGVGRTGQFTAGEGLVLEQNPEMSEYLVGALLDRS